MKKNKENSSCGFCNVYENLLAKAEKKADDFVPSAGQFSFLAALVTKHYGRAALDDCESTSVHFSAPLRYCPYCGRKFTHSVIANIDGKTKKYNWEENKYE